MGFHPPDNIYWLFSSSAQAIAAFIGFLSAGFSFAYERLDRLVEKDETLEEICEDIKNQYYERLRNLFILTGISITLSLLIVYLNGFDLKVYGTIFLIVGGVINIATIFLAIRFVLFIIDPNKVKDTAKKLIKENENLIKPDHGEYLTTGKFLEKFIQLEKLLRSIAERNQIIMERFGNYRRMLPLGLILDSLNRLNLFNKEQFDDLHAISKVRNLAAHGQIDRVDSALGSKVDDLIKQLTLLDKPPSPKEDKSSSN